MSAKRFSITVDHSRDVLLTDFSKQTLKDRYLLPGESYQDLFARVACTYADDKAHAERLYQYMSLLWFMPATPVLANGGTTRGLPISCLTGDMLINTYSGAKWMRDIQPGDMVLTHKGRHRPVVGVKTRMSDNDIYEMTVAGRNSRIKITGNHPVLTNLGWVRVDDLDPETHYVAVNRHIEYPERPFEFEIEPQAEDTPGRFARTQLPTRVPVTTDLAWAIGLWLAEGSHTRNGARFSGLRITVSHDERDFAERWVQIMTDTFGIKGSIYDGKRQNPRNPEKIDRWINAQVNSATLGDLFAKEFGVGCKVKNLPAWAMELPHAETDALLKAFVQGDGCEHNNLASITIANPDLLAGLYNIALKLGRDVSMVLTDRVFDSGHRLTATLRIQEYVRSRRKMSPNGGIRFHDGLLYSPIRSLKKIDKNELVYDIQVAEDESFSVAGVVVHNCFVNEVEDSLESIVGTWNENVWLASGGGGIGTHWGNVRAVGESIGARGESSGIMPFLKVMDSQTLAVSQGSLRRGSAAVYLDVSHPEIEEFIEMRRPTGGDTNRKSLNLHHAVIIPDSFMHAVEAGASWDFVSPKDGAVIKTVDARGLWIRLLTARIETGEPYLMFVDNVNENIPEHHKHLNLPVTTSNLCIEIFLPTGRDHHGEMRTAVCCLSSLNLDTYMSWKDTPKFIEDIMRFLDNVLQDFIDRAPPSMAAAIYSATQERSVGLGVMGFHSFLQSQGVPFESPSAIAWNKKIFKHIQDRVEAADRVLADERGPCPDAAEAGFHKRFSNKSAIAPTASISIICGGVSPCIEPWPANVFTQKTLSGSFPVRNTYLSAVLNKYGKNTKDTWDSIVANKGSVQHLEFLTDWEKATFKTAIELDQNFIIRHAADRQPFIDQGQSVNLFFPADTTKKELHEAHMRAWKSGLKGLYYCRSLSVQRAEVVSEKIPAKNANDGETCEVCQ
jgi:ribonucleoside-diphosphate reductase alpha chain